MPDIFAMTARPAAEVFYRRHDPNDPRLGEIVRSDPESYASADLVIVGCPQDEGVRRNGGRVGAADGPRSIREQFYKLTPFNFKKRVFDLGDVEMAGTLEETHDNLTEVIKQILSDNKRAIVIGGGNDISYADGRAMAEIFGVGAWIGVNVDSHLDVRLAAQRNSGTPYRQLLDEGHLRPDYFLRSAIKRISARPFTTSISAPSALTASVLSCSALGRRPMSNLRRAFAISSSATAHQ